jgi:hypothetical protein
MGLLLALLAQHGGARLREGGEARGFEQPARMVLFEIRPAFCARMMKTACVTSWARCGSRTCRIAAE